MPGAGAIGDLEPAAVPEEDVVSRIGVVGAPVSVVTLARVLALFESWVSSGRDRVVLLRDVHGVMCARNAADVGAVQDEADLVLPDGMPLVWAARLAGAGSEAISRVCGIDLLPAALEYGVERQWRHYFYGASPGVAEKLAAAMRQRHPGIQIVGTHCPPFRPLTVEEDEAVCAHIRAARPDIVWVSLSTPKQDLWMSQHRGKCGGATMVGVGGAFEINAGLIPRAPMWMQRSGLEWLYRLSQEPARLWKRYVKSLPMFVVLTSSELLKVRLGAAKPRGGGITWG